MDAYHLGLNQGRPCGFSCDPRSGWVSFHLERSVCSSMEIQSHSASLNHRGLWFCSYRSSSWDLPPPSLDLASYACNPQLGSHRHSYHLHIASLSLQGMLAPEPFWDFTKLSSTIWQVQLFPCFVKVSKHLARPISLWTEQTTALSSGHLFISLPKPHPERVCGFVTVQFWRFGLFPAFPRFFGF